MVFKFERKSTEKNVKKERFLGYYGKNSVIIPLIAYPSVIEGVS